MDRDATARMVALIDALDNAAAARVDQLEPAILLAVGTIVGSARSDPEWLYGQAHKAGTVVDALLAWVDRGEAPGPDVPELLREAIAIAYMQGPVNSLQAPT